jgi:hypothetical protein
MEVAKRLNPTRILPPLCLKDSSGGNDLALRTRQRLAALSVRFWVAQSRNRTMAPSKKHHNGTLFARFPMAYRGADVGRRLALLPLRRS